MTSSKPLTLTDADVLQEFIDSKEPEKKSKEIEINLISRLRKHDEGLLNSIKFLKALLELAGKRCCSSRTAGRARRRANRAKEAITELFSKSKSKSTYTPSYVEKVVNDIDQIVRAVRLPC